MAAMTLDIGDAGAIEDFARRAIAEHPDLNVLINNAGIMRFESLDRRSDLTDAEATITTNLLGPIRLTNALIDHLSARPDAAIVNVTSGLAFVRSEEHTSELQSLMRISYAVFCLKKKIHTYPCTTRP